MTESVEAEWSEKYDLFHGPQAILSPGVFQERVPVAQRLASLPAWQRGRRLPALRVARRVPRLSRLGGGKIELAEGDTVAYAHLQHQLQHETRHDGLPNKFLNSRRFFRCELEEIEYEDEDETRSLAWCVTVTKLGTERGTERKFYEKERRELEKKMVESFPGYVQDDLVTPELLDALLHVVDEMKK